MPPRPKKDTLVYIINIGVTKEGAESNPLLLKKAKSIVRRMIQHRIFLRPKDEVGVVLMGTADDADERNIKEYAPIQVPNWNIIEEIENLQVTSNCSNCIEAIKIAIDMIEASLNYDNKKRIILISDFNEDSDTISQYDSDDILSSLQDRNIQLHTIGEESFVDKPEDALKPSELFLKALFDQNVGRHRTFDEAELFFRYYEDKPKSPCPWYCTLDLIDKQIPIASYIKTTESATFPSWGRVTDNEPVKNMKIYVDKQRRVYKEEDVVVGYKYGGRPVPFTMIEDNQDLVYKSGKKSYRIYSFTSANLVGLEFWCSCSTRIVLPSNKAAEKPFYSLVQAMQNKNLVAIVRKVHATNYTPKMVALIPCINVPEEPWCLVEIELPYAEDRRIVETRPLKSVLKQLSNEQDEMVDALLESLTVTDDEDVGDVNDCHFLPGAMHDPALQHKWNVLSHRVLKPQEPLPDMEDYLKNAFEAPAIKQRAMPYLQKINQLFDLESINPKVKEKLEAESKNNAKAENNTESDKKMDVDEEDDPSQAAINKSFAEDPEFNVDVTKFADYI